MIAINDFTKQAIQKRINSGLKISNLVVETALDPLYTTDYHIDFEYLGTTIFSSVQIYHKKGEISFEELINRANEKIDLFFEVLNSDTQSELIDFIEISLKERFWAFDYDGDVFNVYNWSGMQDCVDNYLSHIDSLNNNYTNFEFYSACINNFENDVLQLAMSECISEWEYDTY